MPVVFPGIPELTGDQQEIRVADSAIELCKNRSHRLSRSPSRAIRTLLFGTAAFEHASLVHHVSDRVFGWILTSMAKRVTDLVHGNEIVTLRHFLESKSQHYATIETVSTRTPTFSRMFIQTVLVIGISLVP